MAERPEWLRRFRQSMRLVELMDKCFDPDVDPEWVVARLREIALDMEASVEMPPTPFPTPTGGAKRGRGKKVRRRGV